MWEAHRELWTASYNRGWTIEHVIEARVPQMEICSVSSNLQQRIGNRTCYCSQCTADRNMYSVLHDRTACNNVRNQSFSGQSAWNFVPSLMEKVRNNQSTRLHNWWNFNQWLSRIIFLNFLGFIKLWKCEVCIVYCLSSGKTFE